VTSCLVQTQKKGGGGRVARVVTGTVVLGFVFIRVWRGERVGPTGVGQSRENRGKGEKRAGEEKLELKKLRYRYQCFCAKVKGGGGGGGGV